MLRQRSVYEGLCLAALVFFSWRLYAMWTPGQAEIQLPIMEKSPEPAQAPKQINDTPSEKPSRVSFEIIARKNLFNPVRLENWEEPRKAQAVPSPPQNLKPAIRIPAKPVKPHTLILEGIMIYGDKRSALVKDIFKPQAGVQRVRVGDEINGYKVSAMTGQELTLTDKHGTKSVLTLLVSKPSGDRRHTKTIVHARPQASGQGN